MQLCQATRPITKFGTLSIKHLRGNYTALYIFSADFGNYGSSALCEKLAVA